MIVLITATGVTEYGITVLHDADGLGGWPSRAQAFDLVAALPLLWAPVVADYAMNARSPRGAAAGVGLGSGVMAAWYVIVGVLWVFTVSARDVAGFITALPLGAGGLLIVVALEADAIAANLHAASISAGRLGYRWFRPALIVVAILAGAFAATMDGLNIEDALAALGAIMLPLMAVVLARAVFGPAPHAAAWCAWAAGALAYGWINPGDFAGWRDAMEFIYATVLRLPFPLGGDLTSIPATIVAPVIAAGVYTAGAALSRRRRGSDG
jgi:purine-cytosine permease-like protein